MKKIIALALAALMLFAVGCGGSSAPAQQAAPAESAQQAATEAPAAAPTEAPTPEPTAAPTPDPAQWEIIESKFTIVTDFIGRHVGIAQIVVKNTGTVPLYMPMDSITIETSDGKLVDSWTYVSATPSVLLPGEVGAYDEKKTLEDDFPLDAEIVLTGAKHIVPATVDAARLEVSDVEIKAEKGFGIKVIGRATNTGDTEVKMPFVKVLLFDNDGLFLGTIIAGLDDLQPGETGAFSNAYVVALELTPEDVGSFTVYAAPTISQY